MIRWRIDCVNRLGRANASGNCRQGHLRSFEDGACLLRARIDDRVSPQGRLPDRLTKQTLTGTPAAEGPASSKAEGLADAYLPNLARKGAAQPANAGLLDVVHRGLWETLDRRLADFFFLRTGVVESSGACGHVLSGLLG